MLVKQLSRLMLRISLAAHGSSRGPVTFLRLEDGRYAEREASALLGVSAGELASKIEW